MTTDPPDFAVGDYVKTPSGAEAFVVAVDELFGEATVQWFGRHGEQADFKWAKLSKAHKQVTRG